MAGVCQGRSAGLDAGAIWPSHRVARTAAKTAGQTDAAAAQGGAPSAEGAAKPGEKPKVTPLTRLRLPRGPDDARFLEIAIELQVAGAIESAHLDNDRLDVPLREVVEIVLIDEEDDPIPGAKYEIRSGLTVLSGSLDDDGFARVEHLPVKHNKITFPEFAPATNVVPVPDEDVPADLKA